MKYRFKGGQVVPRCAPVVMPTDKTIRITGTQTFACDLCKWVGWDWKYHVGTQEHLFNKLKGDR